jgi:antitoxin (DNA-binding transcriptional repressor) of toxin-antitoxin stability system
MALVVIPAAQAGSTTSDLGCVHICGVAAVAVRVGIRELRAQLASRLESATPIEVTRHGRTIGLYVPLPQQGDLSDRERLLEAGRLMQVELERLGLTEDELSADFKAWRKQRQQSQSI